MKKIIIIVFIFSHSLLYASHIVGGEIYYDYLGNNQYRVSIALYRDCFSDGALYDNPLSLGIFNQNGQLLFNEQITFPGSENIPITFNNSCITPPNDICIEKSIYIKIITLPPLVGGYHLTYQRCCRGPDVRNIIDPDGTGLTLTTHIPGSETNYLGNNSPRFSGYPPTILCNNEELIFNHSATDPDGDELKYTLVPPYSGATSNSPMPSPPPSPPYNNVVWNNNFQTSNPLGGGATISIDENTGILSAKPFQIGLFVVGIRVSEYRNGNLIGSTTRDFLFRVIDCNITLNAEIPNQEDMDYFISYCQGLSVTFDNNSFGATNYEWDFGVTSINTDISTQFEPTYTYPQPGIYQVRLIANPGWDCSDTSFQNIEVNELLEVSYTTIDSICYIANTFNFDGTIIGNQNATITWEFGNSSSITTSSQIDVNNVTFSSTGFIPISLKASSGTCESIFIDSVYIFNDPIIRFNPPPNYLCDGLTVKFNNSSEDILFSDWDFGVTSSILDISTLNSPTFTFPEPGNYIVKLIGRSTGDCIDSISSTLIINEVLEVSFTSQDTLCFTENLFDFDGSWQGASSTTFNWNFGSNASIVQSNDLDVFGVVFDTYGKFPITLKGDFMTCSNTFTDTIFILREPEIEFTILDELRCVPYEANFIDLSISDSPLFYFWEFGNGDISNQQNPNTLYNSAGKYNVNLKIVAEYGCVDTLNLLKSDFIEVYPKPVSRFSLSKTETDICNSLIEFQDLSEGATLFNYNFNDLNNSNQQNPSFTYQIAGTFYPSQIVTSDKGCKDTSRQMVYIIPFNVYIPNAFTPDGKKFNNEYYSVTNLTPEQWDFKIFNRWGELIYQTKNPYDRWNGSYNNKPAQNGIYIYKLNYTSCDVLKTQIEISGHVSLIK